MTEMTPVRLFVRLPYRDHAACVGEPVELFFPTHGDYVTAAKAKLVCERCPVREECLADNLDEVAGIYGGTTGKERRKVRAERARVSGYRRPQNVPQPINHGTEGGASTHIRRGEVPCGSCREAATAAKRERRRKAS